MIFSEFVKKCKTGYPASIPQIVAHIQKYLFDNPILSETDIDEKIQESITESLVNETVEKTLEYIEENPDTLPQMEGATALADGASGLVPKPVIGDEDKFLSGDGKFKAVQSPIIIDDSLSSTSENPVQNKVIKQALDNIPVITVDNSLSSSSENPVQNKVIKQALDNIPVITVDSSLSSSSENPVQNKVIKQALDNIPVITVDNSLSSSSENPVQNKVIKQALDNIPVITVDSSLSSSSENPVQNKVIKQALENKWSSIDLLIDSTALPSAGGWSDGSSSWPSPAPIGSSGTCYKATLTTDANNNTIVCAEGDDFVVSDYTQSVCPAPLYVYVDDGEIIVATSKKPLGNVQIKGLVLHQ